MLAAIAAAIVLLLGRVVRAFFAVAALALLAGGVFLIVHARSDDPAFGDVGRSYWDTGGTAGRPSLGVAMALTGVAALLLVAAWKRASRLLIRAAVLVGILAAVAQVLAGVALSTGN